MTSLPRSIPTFLCGHLNFPSSISESFVSCTSVVPIHPQCHGLVFMDSVNKLSCDISDRADEPHDQQHGTAKQSQPTGVPPFEFVAQYSRLQTRL